MLRIKELREEVGLTQKQLAEAIGSMQRNVSNWEQGTVEPDLATVVALADYFHVTLDELFGRNVHTDTRNDTLKRAELDFIWLFRSMSPERRDALLTLLSDN